MWKSAFLIAFSGCCMPTHGKDIGPSNPVVSKCDQFDSQAPVNLEDIPKECCQFGTLDCHFIHNGQCRVQWDTSDCDYTVNVCHKVFPTHIANWFCTCCAFCGKKGVETQCSSDNGHCRKTCLGDEYPVSLPCLNENCQCCKKHEGCIFDTCASGKGDCVKDFIECPSGHYVSTTDQCEGIGNCKCCKECEFDQNCEAKSGYCEAEDKPCPDGYEESTCIGEGCKCCSPVVCNSEPCASGEGACVGSPEDCPSGYYFSKTDYCQDNENCRCCKECELDPHCEMQNGFCESEYKPCPYGYKEGRCHGEGCKCCSPDYTFPPTINE